MALDDSQIEMLQEFINASAPGVYDAMEIIPLDYLEYFDTPTVHGDLFKAAVRNGLFQNIEHLGRAGNNHQRYKLNGG